MTSERVARGGARAERSDTSIGHGDGAGAHRHDEHARTDARGGGEHQHFADRLRQLAETRQ